MANAYFSTVIDAPATRVWDEIRLFDNYSWSGVSAQTTIENGGRGDQTGSIRKIVLEDGKIRRQQLVEHSDLGKHYSYTICDPQYLPLRNFVAKIRVRRISDTDRSFIEWEATFDCDEAGEGALVEQLEQRGFSVWLNALRRRVTE